MAPTAETIPFQAETKKLLDLVIHSLYTNKEIFLRELISNASDALDKTRIEALTDEDLAVDLVRLRIRLEVDKDARTLSVVDNGIGMSREEVIENIGTIAKSGTQGFSEALDEMQKKGGSLPELIGQFGVGFYSAFMVADEVEVLTRRIGTTTDEGVVWRSKGDGEYTLDEGKRDEHGTTVTLHLKSSSEGESDEASKDFTQEWVLRETVKRYSDFIEYPIEMERPETTNEEGEVTPAELQVLNSRKPLWSRAKEEIEEGEYAEFYKHLSHDWNEPLDTIHFKAEGTAEYAALLYIPGQRPMDLFDPNRQQSRIQLYVKRVFITSECEELLPVWLRFVRGVVDAADLPLNVSRETLQHNRQMGQIEKRLTRKVLDSLQGMQKNRPEDYETFWKSFGTVIKEGIYYSEDHRETCAGLALFSSSKHEQARTLNDYVADMPVAQKEIYVLLASDVESAQRSPLLETFTRKGYEVLFLTDPVDEFVIQRLTTFSEKTIRRIDQGEIDLGDEEEDAEREKKEKVLEPMIEAVRKELSERVEEVRFSKRLTDSPACLVAAANALPQHLVRMMRDQGQDVPEPKQVLELNATHPLIERMGQQIEGNFAGFSSSCELLFGLAQLSEGTAPSDPAKFTQLVSEMMLGNE